MKTAKDLVQQAKQHIKEVSIKDVKQACQTADLIIDVREPSEYMAGHLPNAVSIPRGVLEFKIADAIATSGLESKLVVYCKTGGRASLSAKALQDMGYQNVQSIAGGFEAWADGNMPIEQTNSDVNFY